MFVLVPLTNICIEEQKKTEKQNRNSEWHISDSKVKRFSLLLTEGWREFTLTTITKYSISFFKVEKPK